MSAALISKAGVDDAVVEIAAAETGEGFRKRKPTRTSRKLKQPVNCQYAELDLEDAQVIA